MMDLTPDDVAGSRRLRRVRPIENGRGRGDGGQRGPELVAQHGEQLFLRAVGGLGVQGAPPQLPLEPLALDDIVTHLVLPAPGSHGGLYVVMSVMIRSGRSRSVT